MSGKEDKSTIAMANGGGGNQYPPAAGGNNSGGGSNNSSSLSGDPSFRSCAMNAVALVPLLSIGGNNNNKRNHSLQSFESLMECLWQYAGNNDSRYGTSGSAGITIVVPNAQLTRPGNWRYESTPLRSHDWSRGCQRLVCFDGRPDHSRMAHDRLCSSPYQQWMDLVPSRGTAAVIGILNVRDCIESPEDQVAQAKDELFHHWCRIYGGTDIPRRLFVFDSFDPDWKHPNMFAGSSAESVVAFPPFFSPSSKTPTSTTTTTSMMDLHLNVVINDLTVTIFQNLEQRIHQLEGKRSSGNNNVNNNNNNNNNTGGGLFRRNTIMGGGNNKQRATSNKASSSSEEQQNPTGPSSAAGITQLANIVSANNRLSGIAESNNNNNNNNNSNNSNNTDFNNNNSNNSNNPDDNTNSNNNNGSRAKTRFVAAMGSLAATTAKVINNAKQNSQLQSQQAQQQQQNAQQKQKSGNFLVTPIDDDFYYHNYNYYDNKQLDVLGKRDVARRQKYAADLALLCGSPMDAYERYTRAAELSKSNQDPLWYACSLEGCAASFIAMADMGGHGVDAYLENNFQLPDEIMTLFQQEMNTNTGRNDYSRHKHKTTMPAAVFALAEEALGITSRHTHLAPIHTELLLKLAWYTAEMEESHLRCRWGEGDACFAGILMDEDNHSSMEEPIMRWEQTSVSQMDYQDLQMKYPKKLALLNKENLVRLQKLSDFLHRAVSHPGLDSRTRADCAIVCAKLALRGMKTTNWTASQPTIHNNSNHSSVNTTPSSSYTRFIMLRKAAFFTTVAAESMTHSNNHSHNSSDSRWKDAAAANLWFSASHLYSRQGNPSNCNKGNYGWASIRATVFQALMNQATPQIADMAAEMLIFLLSEISPTLLSNNSNHTTMAEDNSLLMMKDHRDSATQSTSQQQAQQQAQQQQQKPTTMDQQWPGSNNKSSDNNNSDERSERSDYYDDTNKSTTTSNTNTSSNKLKKNSSIFFTSSTPSAITLAQSKWMENQPVSMLSLPLVDSSSFLSSQLMTLNCVVPNVRLDTCSMYQRNAIANLAKLRQDTATSSSQPLFHNPSSRIGIKKNKRKIINSDKRTLSNTIILPPFEVESADIVKSESHVLLEKTKAAGFNTGKTAGPGMSSMATFFNPYAAKKNHHDGSGGSGSGSGTGGSSSAASDKTTLVAAGEERTIQIRFSNRLSVPLDIISCQLQFATENKIKNKNGRVLEFEAPPLSFLLPPEAKSFTVNFPFIVLASSSNSQDSTTNNNQTSLNETMEQTEGVSKKDTNTSTSNNNNVALHDIFELVGLHVAIVNRSFTIPFKRRNEGLEQASLTSTANHKQVLTPTLNSDKLVPDYASVYQRSIHNLSKQRAEQLSLRLESVPAQPNLLVSFTTSQTPLEDNATVPVHLSDGEIYTIPPFRLENDFGPSGLGSMERLQIVGVGLPGLPDEILFDTDELAKALEEEEDVFSDTSEEFSAEDFEELMESDGLPPLKMKCLAEGLSLNSINDKSKSMGEGSVVTFQMAATHDMGNQLANGGNVRIRFRIRGPSPSPGVEIWRKREVALRIVRVKGPRISSLTFRSDLSWGSSYSELCKALAKQKRQWQSVPKWDTSKYIHRKAAKTDQGGDSEQNENSMEVTTENKGFNESEMPIDDTVLYRVGTDHGVYVSGDDIVVLMAVANETNSTIVLSNRQGMVGGFEGSPMPTVKVTSGVSVKIPVVIPRIERLDENNEVMDIASELIARTALQWEAEVSHDSINKNVRHGRVRIPSRCLREIIENYKSFASRICRPPVTVQVKVIPQSGNKGIPDEPIIIESGDCVDTSVEVKLLEWVPKEVANNCCVTLEFCCARKETGHCEFEDESEDTPKFIWCGQLRRTVSADEINMNHSARVAFLETGTFVVSACAKISSFEGVEEEVWWAPHAKIVQVVSISQ